MEDTMSKIKIYSNYCDDGTGRSMLGYPLDDINVKLKEETETSYIVIDSNDNELTFSKNRHFIVRPKLKK